MTCRTATYSKVSVIHEVDIPVGRLSLGGASAFFRTKSRCQNHHIWTTGKAPLECNLSLFFPRAAPSSTPATKLVRAPQMNTSRTFNEGLLFYELSDENDLCSLPSHPFMCSLLVAKLVSSVVHPGSSQIRGNGIGRAKFLSGRVGDDQSSLLDNLAVVVSEVAVDQLEGVHLPNSTSFQVQAHLGLFLRQSRLTLPWQKFWRVEMNWLKIGKTCQHKTNQLWWYMMLTSIRSSMVRVLGFS